MKPEQMPIRPESKPRRPETNQESTRPDIAASLRDISMSYRDSKVLENVSFDVAEGELLVLLGASGSGKTTLLRIIAGLERPNSGQVHLHGIDVTDLPARERGVGVIFQAYALFPHMTVEQNIAYGPKIRRWRRKKIREIVDRLLSLVRLEEHRKKYPAQLSGGQQQRVAIARTLAYNPPVLLFDEPFGAIDAQTRMRLRREIRALLKEVKVPALFITHDQEEALELGDRIAVLNAGHLEQIGTPDEVYNRPATEYVATFLGAANLLIGVMRSGHVEIGNIILPYRGEPSKFRYGQSVKLVFRPEDLTLTKTGKLPDGYLRLSRGLIEEINFAGAYERLVVRLDLAPQSGIEDQPDPRSSPAQSKDWIGVPVTATRSKSESQITKFNVGDRVNVGLRSFSLLPNYTLATESSSWRLESPR